MKNIAINGFGRIGRNILRSWLERDDCKDINIVAINDLGDPAMNAHLLKYDSVHGSLSHDVCVNNSHIQVGQHNILCLNEREPKNLPWSKLNVDIVFECTGRFSSKEAALNHIHAGAKKVLISAPGKDTDATIVYGVNHDSLKASDQIISNASCTTNCLAPLASILDQAVGIKKGLATTIHSYTNDQVLSDVYHSDMLRARSATQSMIPTKTGAASAVGKVLPHLQGKLDGLAVRVPTINVSLLDLTFQASRETCVEEINDSISAAIEKNTMNNVLIKNSLPLVSIDFNHNSASSIVDINQTKVIGDQVKVLSWYDNEWGFSNRMLDTSKVMATLLT